MKNLRTEALERRLKAWRVRLVASQERADDPAYTAICRAEIEKLEDALGIETPPQAEGSK